MLMITVEEARAYAHDYEATDAEMMAMIEAAGKIVVSGTGVSADTADERAKLLCKLNVCDMDDNRTTSAKESNGRRLLISTITLQLKAELAKAAEEASANA